MHGGSEIASSVTTGSWIARLTPGVHEHWVTGTSSPCLSLFKPVTIDDPVEFEPSPQGTVDDSLWWTHERLHRQVMKDPARLSPETIRERDALEQKWFADPPRGSAAFDEHRRLLSSWLDSLPDSVVDTRPKFVRKYWGKREHLAAL